MFVRELICYSACEQKCGLHDTYKGGLSTYATIWLVSSHLLGKYGSPATLPKMELEEGEVLSPLPEKGAPLSSTAVQDLGSALMGLLDFYGTRFTPEDMAISPAQVSLKLHCQ